MMRTVSERLGKLARVAALGFFSLSLVPASGVTAAERPLDFGAALLMPADVAPFGFEDYGIDSGRYFSLQQMLAEGSDVDPNDPAIEEIGMESVHNLFLHPIDRDGDKPGPATTVTSFIYVYDDEEHAEDGFALFEDERDDPTATDLDGAPELGDESELTEYIDEMTDSGGTVDIHEFRFSFRIDRVVAVVAVVGFDEEVDRDDVEAMTAYHETKLLGVMNDGEVDGRRTPGLDSISPRYDDENLVPSRSHYCVLNGQALVHAYDADRLESTQEWVEEFGVVGDYCALTKIMLPSSEGTYALLNVEPMRFSRADGAAAFVADERETVEESEDLEDLEIIELDTQDLPFELDSALVFTYERSENGDYAADLFLQQGRLVMVIRLTGFSTPDVDVALAVAADAFACADETCYETLNPPAELLDYQEEQDELLAEQD